MVLTRADLVTAERRAAVRDEVLGRAPQAAWVEAAHRPRSLVSVAGESTELDWLRGRRVAAFCGVGNPAGFRRTLEILGADVVAFREFPDHHAYGAGDVASLGEWSDRVDAGAVLCTMKDFVKLRAERLGLGGRPLRALAIGVELLAGSDSLESKLSALIARDAT
jgi:tetraacyldisaccharide 4'-kinase